MKASQFISLVLGIFAVVIASHFDPHLLASNGFLDGFVNHELINVIVVISTVSLVSVVQIHMEYTRIERRHKLRVFDEARVSVNRAALILVLLIGLAFFLSLCKAHFEAAWGVSLINGAALLVVLEGVFIMYNLVETVYAIASEEPIDDEKDS